MTRSLPVGHRYDVSPIAPLPEATSYINAGALSIGVEYRRLTDELVDAAFDAGTRAESGIDTNRPENGLEDQGWSVHVCDAETSDEFVRFDGFVGDPHYHYIVPRSHNIVVPFDEVAHGDFRKWTFERLRTRLPDMLREAGAATLAERVDQAALDAAIEHVERAIDDAVKGHATTSA